MYHQLNSNNANEMDNNTTSIIPNMITKSFDSNMMISMILIPIFSRVASKIVEKIIDVVTAIVKVIELIICYIYYYFELKWASKYNSVLVKLSNPDTPSRLGNMDQNTINEKIIDNTAHFLWHIDQKSEMLKSLKLQNDKYIPIPEHENTIIKTKKDVKEDDLYSGKYDDSTRLIKENKTKNNMIYFEKDIYVKFIQTQGYNNNNGFFSATVDILFMSKRKMSYIKSYLEDIKKQYDEYVIRTELYKNKIFIYDGKDRYSVYEFDKLQTFDNLFFAQKNEIIKSINKLDNIKYFSDRGIKRKLSYLFMGSPGSGKTCCVNAIANYTGRSIIYIPISRISTNEQIEKILYSNKYNEYTIPNDKKIFLFDEIDSPCKIDMTKNYDKDSDSDTDVDKPAPVVNVIMNKNDTPSIVQNTPTKNTNNDKFNIGMFLQMLDGIYNQDGMIIIATANSIVNIDKAVFRDGRMMKMNFTNMGRNEIVQMIEKYYVTTLNSDQINKINDTKYAQNLTIKKTCLDAIDNNYSVNDIIDTINSLQNET